MKKIIGSLFLMIVIVFTTLSNCFAYSDELFDLDLPESYINVAYQNMYVFTDSKNEKRGFIIYAREDRNIKKSVWDIDRADMEKLVRSFSRGAKVVRTEKRAKLGKEKAVKIILSDDGDYIDLYILASNKYVYLVTFLGSSQGDLENTDYDIIKKSFKLKDATTNFRVLYVIIVLIIIAISSYLKYRKSNVYSNYNNHKKQEPIDYKNLTEEDFKKM